MKQCLDIISLIDSDYYKNNKRLKWHTSQLKYDEISQDIYFWLTSLELNEIEKEVFSLSCTFIYTELACYVTHVYDYIILNERNIRPKYSNKSNIFIKKIWCKQSITNTLLVDLERNHLENTKIRTIYSLLVGLLPSRLFQFISISRNPLAREYLVNNNFYLQVLPQYYFNINTKSSEFSQQLSKKISATIIKNLEEDHFKLDKNHKQSIEFIVDTYISRAFNDLNKQDSLLKNKKAIITGTGNGYYNRLYSLLANKYNTTVIRFNHGGERCFFNDNYFWNFVELYNNDIYVTYGPKWGDFVRKKAKELNRDIGVKAIGSKYHKKFYDKFFGKKIYDKKKILYIPNSFTGEIRIFPYAKLIDPILFDWQKYLIETLQKNGFEVIYKKHPKGFFQKNDELSKVASYESDKPMIKALEGVDMVLCDMAGSAFIESLCAGKDIVLIDTCQRPFNLETKRDLQTAVKIVEAYWENNTLKIDEKSLVNTFKNLDIDDKNKDKIIQDYFLKTL